MLVPISNLIIWAYNVILHVISVIAIGLSATRLLRSYFVAMSIFILCYIVYTALLLVSMCDILTLCLS